MLIEYTQDNETVEIFKEELDHMEVQFQLLVNQLQSLESYDKEDQVPWPEKARNEICKQIVLVSAWDTCPWDAISCPDWAEVMDCFYDYHNLVKSVSSEQQSVLKEVQLMKTIIVSYSKLFDLIATDVSII